MIFNNWNPTTQDPSFSQNMQKKKVTIKTLFTTLWTCCGYYEPLQNALHCKSSRVLLVIFRGSIQQLASGQCIIFQGCRSRRGQGAVPPSPRPAPPRSFYHIQTPWFSNLLTALFLNSECSVLFDEQQQPNNLTTKAWWDNRSIDDWTVAKFDFILEYTIESIQNLNYRSGI